MSGNALRILIVEPDTLLREGIVCLLSGIADFALVADLASGQALGKIVSRTAPGVLLMDASLIAHGVVAGHDPGSDPKAAPAILAFLKDRTRPLSHPDMAMLIHAGASGFVSIRDHAPALQEAIRSVARRSELYVSPVVSRTLSGSRHADAAQELLTPRERAVLRSAAQGHANARLAEDLGLSIGTVRNHLSAIYAKLGVSSRAEAVAWAWSRRLIQVGETDPLQM